MKKLTQPVSKGLSMYYLNFFRHRNLLHCCVLFVMFIGCDALAQSFTMPTQSSGTFTITLQNVYSWTLQERKGGTSSWVNAKSGSNAQSVTFTRPDGYYDFRLYNCSPYSGGCTTSSSKRIYVDVPDPVPATPTVTVPTTDSDGGFRVSFSRPQYSMTTILERKLNSSGDWTNVSAAVYIYGNYMDFSGLTSGVWYFRARACNTTKECSGFSATKSIKVAVTPGVPSSISTPGTNDGDFTVSWGGASGRVSYYEFKQQFNSGNFSTKYTGMGTSKNFLGLGVGTYRHQVRACNTISDYTTCSGYRTSNNTSVAVPASAPTISLASTDVDGSYGISWNAIGNTRTYRLEEKVGSGAYVEIQNTSALSKSLSGKSNNTYSYRTRACNNKGCSGYSATKTIAVAKTPGVPSSISTPGLNDGYYTVSWGTASGTVNAYKLEYQINGGNWAQIYSGTETSYSFSNFSEGSYIHRVRACAQVGSFVNCSGYRTSGTTVVAKPATVPSLSVPGTDSDGSYSVSWSSVTNTDSYELQQNVNGGGWSTVQNTAFTSKSFIAQPSRRYGYRVRACNNRGCTSFSDAKYINVAIKPGVPPEVRAPNTSSGTHTVQWDSSSGTVGYYELIYKKARENDWHTGYSGGALSVQLSGLTSGNYTHKVRACVNVSGTIACSDYRVSGITSVKSSVALDYSYDALGRLEEVKEDNAAIIAYCYDAAGNRYNVVHNAGSDSCPDEPAPQLPAIVTGLSISSSQGGGYVVSWSPVSDAIWYEVNLPAPDAAFPNQQPPIRIDSPQTTMTTSTQRPINVRACNYYGCSIDASAF